jgi:hypothetical protein
MGFQPEPEEEHFPTVVIALLSLSTHIPTPLKKVQLGRASLEAIVSDKRWPTLV